MNKKPQYKRRIRHHARKLTKAFPIVLGFACGLSEKEPKPLRSTGHFIFLGQMWIVRGTRIHERYDGVELKLFNGNRSIRIHHSRLEGKESEIIATLVQARQAMVSIANGAGTDTVIE